MEFYDKHNNADGKFPDYGAIFMSNSGTKRECFNRGLFGLPSSAMRFVEQIKTGMILFLFEHEKRQLHGVFKAASDGAMNIVPSAFSSTRQKFPAQVKSVQIWHCKPLSESVFRDAIRENYFSATKFNFGLSEKQVGRLLKLFSMRKLEQEVLGIQFSRMKDLTPESYPVGKAGRSFHHGMHVISVQDGQSVQANISPIPRHKCQGDSLQYHGEVENNGFNARDVVANTQGRAAELARDATSMGSSIGGIIHAHETNSVLYPVLLRGGPLDQGNANAVVIGGMVLDVHATPSIAVNRGTTVPGKVYYVQGGVARNIAECMSKLGAKPFMISALGFDMAGDLLLEQWISAGLSIEGILKDKDIETPVVCNIFEVNGEVAAGVASVEAVEKYLSPDWIFRFKSTLLSAPVVMVDANLSPLSLEASCKMAADVECPLWFEPVSVTKSRRIISIANYVTFASPNEDELIAMANALSGGDEFCPLKDNHMKNNLSTSSLFQMLKPAICFLIEKGIKVVIVTLGSNGVFLCSKGEQKCFKIPVEKTTRCGFGRELYKTVMQRCPPKCYSGFSEHNRSSHLFAVHLPSLPASVVRLTGAGDCLVGGTLTSLCSGLDIMQSVSVGIAVAKASVEVEANVPSSFSLAAIADDTKSVYSSAKVLFHQSML